MLDRLIVNGQISASALKHLARMARQAQPAAGAGVARLGDGFAHVHDRIDLFLAEITAVSGTGADAVYGFDEQDIKGSWAGGDAGDLEDRPNGRTASPTVNPARWAGYATGDLADGDLVLVRRSVSDVNEWEVLAQVVAAAALRYGRVTAKSGTGGSATYTVTLVNPATGSDVSPTESVAGVKRPPSRTAGDVYPPDIETNGKTFKFFTSDGAGGWIFTDAVGSFKEDTFILPWSFEDNGSCVFVPATQKTITVQAFDLNITEGSEVPVP